MTEWLLGGQNTQETLGITPPIVATMSKTHLSSMPPGAPWVVTP